MLIKDIFPANLTNAEHRIVGEKTEKGPKSGNRFAINSSICYGLIGIKSEDHKHKVQIKNRIIYVLQVDSAKYFLHTLLDMD